METKELIKKVKRIQLKASRLVNDVLAGEYSSVFKGRGMEFDEVRLYVPGDEVRTIDWNVTARTGVPHVKRFVEERELTVMLLVDQSPSGSFGTTSQLKSEVAAEICALLALSAIQNNDKVGLILFTGEVEKFIPPKKGKRHVLRLIRELLQHEPEGRSTEIGKALDFLLRVQKKRAVVFLLSDFIAETSSFEKSFKLARRRHDVVAMPIADPREIRLPPLGLLELEDAETGEILVIDSGDLSVRSSYEKINAESRSRLKQLFQSIDADQVEIETDSRYVDAILRFFKMRERRLR
ncbi:MAG: DUF58 domain-containing protein [Planctomycetes bacterium]|nr:DUF58 domain-containing protein [Planctomycetota bacterium]